MSTIGIDARLWNETGVGRYIRNLVKELQVLNTNHEFVLFALSKDIENIKYQISNFKFQVKRADIRWHTLQEQVKFGNILEKENLDLVHFPYFSVPIFVNTPFVLTIHDLILHHFPTGKASTLPLPVYYLKQLGYRFVVKSAAQKAKKIITVSQATATEIQKNLHIPKEKIVVTYEGVDKNISNAKSQISDVKYSFFLYVGNAYPHKNLERLIEAFSLFINEQDLHPDPLPKAERKQEELKLILVGKEDYFYKRLKEKVIQMGLAKEIIFKNFVSEKELADLYYNAEALILPSLMEGFGLPGLEAMQNSCLVACSNIPSFKEIYADGAIYFDPNNREDIAKSFKTIYSMSKKEKDTYIQKGKKQVENFSWTKMAAQTLEVYESCIGL